MRSLHKMMLDGKQVWRYKVRRTPSLAQQRPSNALPDIVTIQCNALAAGCPWLARMTAFQNSEWSDAIRQGTRVFTL